MSNLEHYRVDYFLLSNEWNEVGVDGGRIKYPISHVFCTHESVTANSSQSLNDTQGK